MAMRLRFTQDQGFVCPKAESYLKITHISGNKDRMKAEITMYHQVGTDLFPCGSRSVGFAPNLADGATNFIAQAYAVIKALPDFSTAEDC